MGHPLEILVLGSLTLKSPRCFQSCKTETATSSVVVHPAFWRVASRVPLGPEGSLSELVQSLGHVVPGLVCEEHVDDLSQLVANTSRMQLFHDAALIGKAMQINALSDICLGTSATDCGVRGDVLTNGNAEGKVHPGPREFTVCARRILRRKNSR